MNTQGLKKVLANKFSSEAIDIKENVFKIDASFGKRTFAKYYFDCTNSFLSEDFDLLAYQQALMADDYYESNGPLQWNFYLYFITDVKSFPSETRSKIESDKNFSRKLITDELGLIKLFEVQEKLKANSVKPVDNSLLSVWKEKLRKVNLHGVFLPDAYPKNPEVYSIFFERKTFAEPAESTEQVSSSTTQTGIISQLSVDGYRSFNGKQEFDFRKVNLIKGVNGTGKTSLLEALELCICGQTYENRKKQEPHKEIFITYQGGVIDKYTPRETKKYQERDRVWFGNSVLKSNSLSQGFHVYNFFDSDTAARFASETKGDEIQKIFSSIVLGEQTNVVFDRIERVFERVAEGLKQVTRDLNATLLDIAGNRQKLKELEAGSSVINILGEIIEKLREVDWRATSLLLTEDQDKSKFQTDLNSVNVFFKSINEITWLSSKSIDGINDELIWLEKLEREYATFVTVSEQFRKDFDANKERVRAIDQKILALDAALPYLSEPAILEISTIQQRLKQETARSRSLERISNLLGQFLTDYGDKGMDIILSSLQGQVAKLLADQSRLSGELEELESKMGRVKAVRAELKGLGKEFIRLTSNDSHCPLCSTEFPGHTLSEVIDALEELETNAGSATQLVSNLSQISNSLSEQQGKIAVLQDIRKSMQVDGWLLSTEPIDETIYAASDRIRNIYARVKEEMDRLAMLSQRFSDLSLSSDGLSKAKAQLKDAQINLSMGLEGSTAGPEMRQQLSEQRGPLLEAETNLQSAHDEKRRSISQAFANYFQYLDSDSAKYLTHLDQMNSRLKLLKSVVASFSGIDKFFTLSSNQDLGEFAEKFGQVNRLFGEYQGIFSNDKLRQEWLKRGEILKSKLAHFESDEKLLSDAYKVLNEIITVNNKENFLKTFFTSNKENILNIFRAIHLPNEFHDITFESTESIKLKVSGGNEMRDLTEISTGQKSAFILSLFLTLNNNLKSGPPIMLFDDPVAYVDDINTLSFLDFLRDQVITSNRQIFFATANSKLANLFQQKFSFLENEFSIIDLEKTIKVAEDNV